MKTKFSAADPDGSFAALKRAAKRAKRIAEETGTEFVVVRPKKRLSAKKKERDQAIGKKPASSQTARA